MLANDLFRHAPGHFLVVVELHGVHAAALGAGSQVGSVAKHFAQGDEAMDALLAQAGIDAVDPAAATPEPPLRNGSQGEKVWKLQSRLQELGYYAGEVDGQFGNGTKEAVVAFQAKNGLDPDGMAGPDTLNLLYSDEALSADR